MNQLRANLELAFPGAVGLFSRPDSSITLAFLRRFPTAAKASWLSPARLDRWLRSVGYSGGIAAETLYRHLERAAPGLDGVEAEARGEITIGLVATIETLSEEIARIEARSENSSTHTPTRRYSRACRGRGIVRAATLLA